MNVRNLLSYRIHTAMQAANIPADYQAHIALSKKAEFGDYQANGAMAAAKALGKKPREVAQSIVDNLDLDGIAEKVEIAGPGFINIYLDQQWVAEQVAELAASPQKALAVQSPKTIVIDYSSPNLAKEMHVGHLRSTIIGDALARILEQQGNTVIRQNHVGDWGTQFGMLLVELEDQLQEGESNSLALKDLEGFYQQAKKHFDSSDDFKNKARDYVVKLQSGDINMLRLWEQFKRISLQHSEDIYQTLNVTLTPKHIRGESAYNADLPILVDELNQKQLAVEDQGAKVVFLEELADKEGKPKAVIVQKQGGGFLYATTDLAALRYRATSLNANRILYFIDTRQSQHMKEVFTIARKAGFVDETVSLEHHAFGMMLGPDGQPFKTRSGDTVKLADLLSEAVERAQAIIAKKNTTLSESEQKEVARKIGIGSVKYADLSKTRTNDYLFNWEAMLNFEGNTAPYLQYAYTRIQSIFRKAAIAPSSLKEKIILEHDAEKALAQRLLQFSETIELVSKEAYPHILCTYLYDLASAFMRFFEFCPVLKSDVSDKQKLSRLRLCHASATILKTGLELLGIEVMDKM